MGGKNVTIHMAFVLLKGKDHQPKFGKTPDWLAIGLCNANREGRRISDHRLLLGL
jgi:hypothetical protein